MNDSCEESEAPSSWVNLECGHKAPKLPLSSTQLFLESKAEHHGVSASLLSLDVN